MGQYTQDNRLIKVHTPLGKDALLLRGFEGEEGVSRLFHFDLRLSSEESGIKFADIVGRPATVSVALSDGSERYINGVVSHFEQGGSSQLQNAARPSSIAHYRAELVPWLWLLTKRQNCRIFQNVNVTEIITKIFNEHGCHDFVDRLHGSFEPREYCVQYRESDFDFVSRLMEEEGIFYFFEHEAEKHTLVLANHPEEFKPSPYHPFASYKPADSARRDDHVISRWGFKQELRSGKYEQRDYNFEQPSLDLTASLPGSNGRKYEIYDYPGRYEKKSEGERLTRIRMEEEETPAAVAAGRSNCRGLSPGYRFELNDHYRTDLNKPYVVITIRHKSNQGDNYNSTAAESRESFTYENEFECVPYPVPFRPPRTTARPYVRGSQTATVVGQEGEEIWVDKYGRVKVQFRWDREGKFDENSSCWVRVAQLWAGAQWGAMFIPRIGQEVIVDFLEGDPDQPIIIGQVYNGESMPPYALPDEKTKSTVKSYSSKGGGGFNEIRFEDKKGSEQLFIHAEKNLDTRVKNDSLEWVGKDRHLIVKGEQREQVDGDKHGQVKGDLNEKVDGTVSLKAAMDIQEKAGMNYALEAGTEIHLKAGMNLVIEAGATLTLKVGGNFINLNTSGVYISGTMVMINSGGAAGSGSGASPEAPKAPLEADKAIPGRKIKLPPRRPVKPTSYSPGALVLKQAAKNGTPFCEICGK